LQERIYSAELGGYLALGIAGAARGYAPGLNEHGKLGRHDVEMGSE
jgi:hypothetical protein